MGALPGTALKLDAANPWPGLASYDEAASQWFQGREADSAELRRLIKRSPFVLLYGKSGLGKTSLLQAGVFPALRREHFLPVHLRLDYDPAARTPLFEQAARRIEQVAHEFGNDVEPRLPGEGLWAWLQRKEQPFWSADNYPLTPVLVFDQFEELFSRGGSPGHVREVQNVLADLVGNRMPGDLADDAEACARVNLRKQQYHVLLSFRSDFLAEVETWARQASLPRGEAMHLVAMSREQAIGAVQQAGAAVVAPGVAARIVDFLLEREGGQAGQQAGEVEPVLLSLCCYQLNLSRRQQGQDHIDEGLVARAGQGILKAFYDEALQGLDAADRRRVATFIEDNLILGDRYRNSYPLAAALDPARLQRDELDHLVTKRLLRVDPQGSEVRIELIHDRLVGVVRDARDARLAEQARERERAESERRQQAELDRLREEREAADRKAAEDLERQRQQAEREAQAERLRVEEERGRQAERLRAAEETLRIKTQAKNKQLGTALTAVVLALCGIAWMGWDAIEKNKALNEALAKAKDSQKTLEQERARIADELADVKTRVTALQYEIGSSNQQAYEAIKEVVSVTDKKLQAAQAIRDTVVVNDNQLAVHGWRVTSGGCAGSGEVSASGDAVFYISKGENKNVLSLRFNGESDKPRAGFVAKANATIENPTLERDPKGNYYVFDTEVDWTGGKAPFTSRMTTRLFVNGNGVPQRANMLSNRTDCKGR